VFSGSFRFGGNSVVERGQAERKKYGDSARAWKNEAARLREETRIDPIIWKADIVRTREGTNIYNLDLRSVTERQNRTGSPKCST